MKKKSRLIEHLLICVISVCVFLAAMETALSAVQVLKWKLLLKPYHLSPVFRPLARIFIKDDFFPRTHDMSTNYFIPWDYKTDRMRPGKHSQASGLPDFTVNTYGIRGNDFIIPKPPGVYRIVIFGGSSTLGLESADNDTYPAILQRILNDDYQHLKIEVLNYGMSSKSMYYIGKHYFYEIADLQPDAIIINNIRNTWFYDQNQNVCSYADIFSPFGAFALRCNNWLTDNLLLYRFLRKTCLTFIQSKMINYSQPNPCNKVFFGRLYYNTARAIAEDARRRKIHLMFIFEPMYGDKQTLLKYRPYTNESLYNILRANTSLDNDTKNTIYSTLIYNNLFRLNKEFPEIALLDPIADFLDAEAANPKNIFYDYLHLLPQGNRLLAKMIFQTLEKEKWIQEKDL